MTHVATEDVYTGPVVPGLDLVAQGKVRDIYAIGDDQLLLVTTDRVSAFDVILDRGIPGKGRTLTAIARHWFDSTGDQFPNHLVSDGDEIISALPDEWPSLLEGRTMLVARAEVIPFEMVVRGYLAGSGWREYQETQSVCGVPLPEGLVESSRLPEPILTPTTKSDEHDEPVSFEEMLAAEPAAAEIRDRALGLFQAASDALAPKGVFLADTKFEFGRLPGHDEAILVDEILTPDSSRFWPVDKYEPGKPQESMDKEYLRQWLMDCGFRGQGAAPLLPDSVVTGTAERYQRILEIVTGPVS